MSESSAHHTWVITREAEDADADVRRLREAGMLASSVPSIECVPLAWPSWSEQRGTSVYFLTSRRAAMAFPPEATGVVAAMAPVTAKFLRNQGRAPGIEATGGAEALAYKVLSQWERQHQPVWHVRYPTSDAGMETTEQAHAVEVLRPIGHVERKIAYQTRPIHPERLRAALLDAIRDPWNLTFASPSAVLSFLSIRLEGIAAPRRVLCSGASTFRAWVNASPASWPLGEQTHQSLVDTLLSMKGNER